MEIGTRVFVVVEIWMWVFFVALALMVDGIQAR